MKIMPKVLFILYIVIAVLLILLNLADLKSGPAGMILSLWPLLTAYSLKKPGSKTIKLGKFLTWIQIIIFGIWLLFWMWILSIYFASKGAVGDESSGMGLLAGIIMAPVSLSFVLLGYFTLRAFKQLQK